MSWKRLGLVYAPDGSKAWARTHAALPLPLQIDTDVFRFFFSARDAERRSHVGWVDVDLSGAPRVIREASEPALSPGEDGAFDDSGVSIGSLAQTDDGVYLYYMGWKLGVNPPWRNAIGAARADIACERFERVASGAILDQSAQDPHTLSYPCVIRSGPRQWHMWYGSNLTADLSPDGMAHVIKLARSQDGIRWERDGATALGFADPGEHVLSRPSVVRIGNTLLMCFACRGTRYRIGAAYSADGLRWNRIDGIMGLDPAIDGWEQGVGCYPALFQHRERLWLAYNGSGYGARGFGLAVWDGDDPSSYLR
jgi:hypothetical protein